MSNFHNTHFVLFCTSAPSSGLLSNHGLFQFILAGFTDELIIHLAKLTKFRDLPNELLLWVVSHLDGNALFALAKSCKDLNFRLQPSIWKCNIEFQNSNLLHLAVKYDNVGLAEALLQHNANINAIYRGKTPLMRALNTLPLLCVNFC